MTAIEQQKLGKTLWGIADKLRGAMNADDFRDYMLSFLFLRYLSDNYERSRKKRARFGLSEHVDGRNAEIEGKYTPANLVRQEPR